MMIVLLVTLATLIRTIAGTHVGPLHLNETFAQVQQALGQTPVTKRNCDNYGSCIPTMSYTDGASTVVVTAQPLSPYPAQVRSESQRVSYIELFRGQNTGSARISKPAIAPIEKWTWESYAVFAPVPRDVSGWKRTVGDKQVEFHRDVCGLTTDTGSVGQLNLDMIQLRDPRAHWTFTLGYIEFAEGC